MLISYSVLFRCAMTVAGCKLIWLLCELCGRSDAAPVVVNFATVYMC